MSDQPKATGAGRGVLYIAFAKFYFLFVGMAVQFTLPRFLSAEQFGRYGLVNYLTSWFNNVAVTGTIQSVSKFATQDPAQARAVQNAALRMHLRVGLPVAILFAAAAPLVAWFYDDPAKTVPLALAAGIVGGYSFYAVFVGTANGTHQFHKQAGLDITFATLRAIGLLGMAAAGLGVAGVIGGWVAAVGVITMVAIAWVGTPGKVEKISIKPMLSYFGGVAIYLLLFNALMFVDSFILERVLSAKHSSLVADTANGYYVATQQLARVSYQAIIAATFVVFPLVSRSTFTEDKDTTKRYIEVTNRYSLAFATAIAVVLASNPESAMGLLYKPEYAAAGGPALVPLAFGNVAFAMFAIAGTILNGAGRSRAAITSAAITLALAAIGNYVAISMYADSEHVLEIAATVTASAMLVGAAIASLQLVKLFGASVPGASIVRVAIAGGAAFAAGHFAPLHGKGKLMTLVLAAAVAVVFVVVLVATRELGPRDLEAIKAVRRKRGPGGGDA